MATMNQRSFASIASAVSSRKGGATLAWRLVGTVDREAQPRAAGVVLQPTYASFVRSCSTCPGMSHTTAAQAGDPPVPELLVLPLLVLPLLDVPLLVLPLLDPVLEPVLDALLPAAPEEPVDALEAPPVGPEALPASR